MKILKDINIIFISLQKDYANSTNSYKKLIKITRYWKPFKRYPPTIIQYRN